MAAALAETLLDAALALFLSRNIEITPECHERLRAFAETGARALAEHSAGKDEIRKAEVRIVDFAMRMTDEALYANEAVLSEQTFLAAREFFCPGLRPFC